METSGNQIHGCFTERDEEHSAEEGARDFDNNQQTTKLCNKKNLAEEYCLLHLAGVPLH